MLTSGMELDGTSTHSLLAVLLAQLSAKLYVFHTQYFQGLYVSDLIASRDSLSTVWLYLLSVYLLQNYVSSLKHIVFNVHSIVLMNI